MGIVRAWLLHPLRYRRAKQQLAVRRVRRVLVLCQANLCRSPFLEGALRRLLDERGLDAVDVSSAGFTGEERSSPATAVAVAAEMGVDLSAHRSSQVLSHALGQADVIVVMSPDQARAARWRGAPDSVPVIVLGDLDSVGTEARTIADPYNRSDAVFRAVYSRIERCARELVTLLAAGV